MVHLLLLTFESLHFRRTDSDKGTGTETLQVAVTDHLAHKAFATIPTLGQLTDRIGHGFALVEIFELVHVGPRKFWECYHSMLASGRVSFPSEPASMLAIASWLVVKRHGSA